MRIFRSLILAATALACGAQETGHKAHFFLGFGYTLGGDTLADVQFSDGDSSTLKAGKGVHMKAGLDYRWNKAASFQLNLGYHVDDTKAASNGSASFTRVPFEALLFWHPKERTRLGLGIRKANSVKLSSSGAASSIGDYDFNASTAMILDLEFLGRKSHYGQGGFEIRFVSEKFTLADYPGAPSIDGSHLGLSLNWYF